MKRIPVSCDDTPVLSDTPNCDEGCSSCTRERRALLREEMEKARQQLECKGYSESTLNCMFEYLERTLAK